MNSKNTFIEGAAQGVTPPAETFTRVSDDTASPGGLVVKSPPANSGDTGSIPGPRRSHIPRSN